jgi:NADH-quinone oxidoreductase subunit N
LPDVYEGSSSAMAGFLAIVPKIAALVVTFRILEIFLNTNDVWTTTVLYIVVVVTMTVPNMIALVQKDVKRMLAYSSISHAGFVMAAILVNSSQSLEAMFLYWILFLFTALGAFGMLWANREKNNSDFESDHAFTKFSGLVKKHPLIASLMAIFMLSLAGIPPFALFWGKIYLLGSVINEGFIVLALIMALNSAIAGYYYLKLIVVMFFKEPLDDTKISYFDNASFVVKISLFVAAVGTVFAVFWLDDLSALITNYISISGF